MQIKILKSGEKFHLDNSVGAALVSAGLAELIPNAFEPKPPVPSPGWGVGTSTGGRAVITFNCPACRQGGSVVVTPPEGWLRKEGSDAAFGERIREVVKPFVHCGRQDKFPDELVAAYIRTHKANKLQPFDWQPERAVKF